MSKIKAAVVIVISLLILVAVFYVGLFLGDQNGFTRGQKEGFAAGRKASQDIKDAANPYAELEKAANPFQEGYENPF